MHSILQYLMTEQITMCGVYFHLVSRHTVQFLDPGPTHCWHNASQSSHTPSSDM